MSAVEEMSLLASRAGIAAGLLKLMANEKRLLILCRLAIDEEAAVGTLAESVDLSQSALSQHLARMREEGLVTTRREGQTILYRIADQRAASLLAALKTIFCTELGKRNRRHDQTRFTAGGAGASRARRRPA
jgi:DNA-binding transcriptional ArsR family regulator